MRKIKFGRKENKGAKKVSVDFIGPMLQEPNKYKFAVDGYEVPHIYAGKQDTGDFLLFLDGRFGYGPYSPNEIIKLMPLLANAMAITAGYSCHGENSRLMNPHARKVGIMTPGEEVEPE